MENDGVIKGYTTMVDNKKVSRRKDIDPHYSFSQESSKLTTVKVHSSVVVLKEVKYTTTTEIAL